MTFLCVQTKFGSNGQRWHLGTQCPFLFSHRCQQLALGLAVLPFIVGPPDSVLVRHREYYMQMGKQETLEDKHMVHDNSVHASDFTTEQELNKLKL